MTAIYNKILGKLILPVGQKALGGNLLKPLNQYRDYQWLSQEQLQKIQLQKLQNLLQIAQEKSPYYQQFPLDPEAPPEENLRNFPVLTKKNMNANVDKIATQPLNKLHKISTSGSSGERSEVYFNKDELMIPRAIQLLWWEWAGYRLGDTILQTGVNTDRTWEKQLKDWFFRTRYIDAFNHNSESVKQELLRLRKSPKRFFCGFASSLYLFAKVAEEERIKDLSFNGIISFGEHLFPHYKELIERVFQTRVFDTYGCAEGLMIAGQCTYGNYHIMAPHVYLEVMDGNGEEVGPGQIGRVVVTALDNGAFPLIRYEVGDLAVKGNNKPCACQRGLPLLKEVIGRKTDLIQTPKGQFITVQTITGIMKHFDEINQFKFVKNEDGAFILYFVPVNGVKMENCNKIQEAFEKHLNEPLNLQLKEVKGIQPSPSGKVKLMENHFDQ